MRRLGFTLLEMLLAVGLSCILLYGLMRAFMSVTKYVDVLRETATMQRTVGLAFYQLRVDLSAAFVPEVVHQDETKEEKEKRKKDEDQLTPERKAAQEKAEFKPYFLLSFDENTDAAKIDGVRRHPLKQLSFVTTNPLHVYAQKQPCLVRVAYELVPNKKRSTRDREVFSLVRKEVTDITNAAVKESLKDKDTTTITVQSYVIADNLAGAYCECEILKKDLPRKKEDAEKEIPEDQCVQSTSWGDKENLQGFVPRTVTCWLLCWEGQKNRKVLFSETIAIQSYPSQRPKPEDKKAEEAAQADNPRADMKRQPNTQQRGVAMIVPNQLEASSEA